MPLPVLLCSRGKRLCPSLYSLLACNHCSVAVLKNYLSSLANFSLFCGMVQTCQLALYAEVNYWDLQFFYNQAEIFAFGASVKPAYALCLVCHTSS